MLIFNKLEAKKPLAKSAASLIKELWRIKKNKTKDKNKLRTLKKNFHRLQHDLKAVDSV